VLYERCLAQWLTALLRDAVCCTTNNAKTDSNPPTRIKESWNESGNPAYSWNQADPAQPGAKRLGVWSISVINATL
jgi:hypothetical protein